MKRIIIAAAAVVAVLGLGAAAQAERPPTVNHPEGQCDGTFIKDQGPNSGLTVTVAYTGNMWLKISNQHVPVPAVSAGEVYTPQNLSSWPRNQNGRPQDISHVDYCVPPVVTIVGTTVPETTVVETTVPETTVVETTVPETTVVETTVPETTVVETTVPETTVVDTTTPETTEPTNDTTTSTSPPSGGRLPTTGGGTTLAILAAAIIGGGISLTRMARRA